MFALRTQSPENVRTQARGVTRVAQRAGDDMMSGVTTLLAASGRGGSGTTLISVMAALAAAGDGKRVLLIDASETLGPVSILLGFTPAAAWPQLRAGGVSPAAVVTRLSGTLSVVAGGTGSENELQPMSAPERRACMRRLMSLRDHYDLVIIDCGSRLDTLTSVIQPHRGEKLLAVTNGSDPVTLAATYALTKSARLRHPSLPLSILVNRQMESDAQSAFSVLASGAETFLGASLGFAGSVPEDVVLNQAISAGMPFQDAIAGSPAAVAVHRAVMMLTSSESPSPSHAGL